MNMSAADPDAIPLSDPEAIAYAERVEAWGRAVDLPSRRVAYGDDRGQMLEIYTPSTASAHAAPLPILLFFHGGAWISGHLGWLRFMAPAVLALRAIFVAGTYRLAPRCRWPAQFDDVRQALATVRRIAADWGGDPDRIVIGGHSAGGHLAALAALRDGRDQVRACTPVSSSFDLRYGDVPLDSGAGRVYRYLFAHRDQDQDASPLHFAGPGAVPFHIVWGSRDLERVQASGERMVTALRRHGNAVSRDTIDSASHFDTHTMLGDPGNIWYTRLRGLLAAASR